MQEIESMWIELNNDNQKHILLVYVYRPPNSHADWVTKFETMLVKVDTEDNETIIMGDFNMDVMSSKKNILSGHTSKIFST